MFQKVLINNMKNTGLKLVVKFFSNNNINNINSTNNIIDIHKYLMERTWNKRNVGIILKMHY